MILRGWRSADSPLLGVRPLVSSVRSLRSLLDQRWLRSRLSACGVWCSVLSARCRSLLDQRWLRPLLGVRPLVSSVRSLRSLLDQRGCGASRRTAVGLVVRSLRSLLDQRWLGASGPLVSSVRSLRSLLDQRWLRPLLGVRPLVSSVRSLSLAARPAVVAASALHCSTTGTSGHRPQVVEQRAERAIRRDQGRAAQLGSSHRGSPLAGSVHGGHREVPRDAACRRFAGGPRPGGRGGGGLGEQSGAAGQPARAACARHADPRADGAAAQPGGRALCALRDRSGPHGDPGPRRDPGRHRPAGAAAAARRHDLPLAQRRDRGCVVHEGDRRRPRPPSSASCGCRSAPGCSGWWRSRGRRTSPRTTRPTSASCTATTSTPPWRASRSAPSSGCRSPSRARSSARCWPCTARCARSPPSEVALLTSFAAHAAVALENARLFEQARAAVAAADEANAELRARSEATERAAHAHDRLTDVLLHGGGVVEVGRRAGRGARRPALGVRRGGAPARRRGHRDRRDNRVGRRRAGEDLGPQRAHRGRSLGRRSRRGRRAPRHPRAATPPNRWTCPNNARWSAAPS